MKYLGPTQSGSEAGVTYSRNRFGQYVRRRAVPVQPRTPSQVVQRGRMSTNSAAWRALTSTQRAGWTSLGGDISRDDSLGQSYTFNGFMAYCSVNNNNLDAGNAIVSDAPALATPADVLTATVTATSGGSPALSIAYTATPLPTGTKLFVYASPPVSAGRTFNGDYRLVFVSAAAAASPANILSVYIAKFGALVAGTKIFFQLQTYFGGFRSGPFLVSSVVA